MPKQSFSEQLHIRHQGTVKPFWTQKEYEYQNLILNGWKVTRELNGYAKDEFPKARVDLYYDGPDGLGEKRIIGVEAKVYKEATKFFNKGELFLFNRDWTKAKYEGAFNYKDPLARQDISDDSIPPWHSDKKNWLKKNKLQERNTSPLQDILLTNNIDPKELAPDGGLSSLYNYIQGKRELPKAKAQQYAELFGVAPQTLLFDTKTIPSWGNVDLNEERIDDDNNKFSIGEIKYNEVYYYVPCPAEIYRVDVKAVNIKHDFSVFGGKIAYYYETDGIAPRVNNRLCMIRTYEALEDDKGNRFGPDEGYYKYYLGIYQIYGKKVRILNPDPTSEKRILAEDVDVDLAAPIVAVVDPRQLEPVHNIKPFRPQNINKIKQLIAEDENQKKLDAKYGKLLETMSTLIKEEFYDKDKQIKEDIKYQQLQKEFDKAMIEREQVKKEIEKIKKDLDYKLYKSRQKRLVVDFLNNEKKRA